MKQQNKEEEKMLDIMLERKLMPHIVKVMKLREPLQIIRMFEKNIGGAGDSRKIIEFEITQEYFKNKYRIYREK